MIKIEEDLEGRDLGDELDGNTLYICIGFSIIKILNDQSWKQ